jgi:hypothetical protein
MRRFAVLLLSVAALAATTELASARDGCGYGRYHNGYRCVPMGWRGDARVYRDYNRPTYGYGVQPRCPHNWTVQDGVCKPYRGY